MEHYTLKLYPISSKRGTSSIRRITLSCDQPGSAASSHPLLDGLLRHHTLSERMRYNERRLEAMADRALADRQLWSGPRTTGTGLRVLDQICDCTGPASAGKNGLPPRLAQTAWCDSIDGGDSPACQCLQDGHIRVTELTFDASNCSSSYSNRAQAERLSVTTAPCRTL